MSPLHRPLALALACLSPLVGVASPAWAQQGGEPDFGTFADVPVEHWAYLTVETLVRKYKAMAGFPDSTFRGDRPVTRYELAAALERVLDRMKPVAPVAPPPSATDVEAARAVADALDLTGLTGRVKELEAAIAKASSTGPTAVRVGGSLGGTWMDNTQDTLAPFARTNLAINLTSSANGYDMAANMNGAIAPATVGNMPGPAGGGKPPESNWRFGNAHISTRLADTRVRMGLFSPAGVFYPGSDNPAGWGGIVGNGFISPDVNSVRWGARAAALAAARAFGPVDVAAAITPTHVVTGVAWKATPWLSLKGAADVDQPDWWNVTPNRATARNFTALADMALGPAFVTLHGNVAKSLLQGSAQVSWSVWRDVRLNVGAVYSESEKAVTELTPGVSLVVPAMGPTWLPAVTIGLKEPQVVWAQDPKVNLGPGSLLGEQAGLSVVTDWQLGGLGYPNVRFEYNLQQPVLFYSIYDATFALNVNRGF
ncbi:MAG: S-layer homology domain-containing protein [Candidatus Sericytochromatia bacterium]|nr:S-layer homology domain-containing protein [Candidatus Sericytochromatia bacterium]